MTATEPPTETQQYQHGGHQPWCGPECTTMHYPPVPAETQQDFEDPSPSCRGGAHGLCVSGPRCGCPCHEPPDTSWATALAARPSADTETLLASVLRKLMADRHVFLALSTHRTETGMPVQFTLDDTTVGLTDAEADAIKHEAGW